MPIEIDFLLMLQEARNALPDFVTSLFAAISWLAASPLPMLTIAVVLWCVSKEAGYYLGFSYTVANGIAQTLKCALCVNRPWVLDARITPEATSLSDATGYSLPSGHTTAAGSVYGGFAVKFRKHRWLAIALVALIVLTAFSRLWLGCHTPKDVLVALLIAGLALYGAGKFFAHVERHPDHDLPLALVAIAVGIAALAFVSLKGYPLDCAADGTLLVDAETMKVDCFRGIGAYLGFFVAWVIERRFVKFSAAGSVRTRVIRGIIGVALIAVIYLALLPILTAPLGEQWGKFVKYFMVLICVGDLYPLCFMHLERRLKRAE